MNCANHPDRERAAFCQNCGKPLCTECIRNVGNSIFCEPCLIARVGGTAPGYGYPGTAGYPPPSAAGYPPAGATVPSGDPNPGLAALLGFIPGVGAMYNEQYGKGIVHLIVFAILVTLASDVHGIFGLFIAGWIFYMAIEAHHTARARRDGTPLPNPFGLNDISERLGFGKAWAAGAPSAPYSAAPSPDPAAQPNPNAQPAGSYAPPYTYPYVPPTAHWGAPQETYPYGVPPVPPVPQVPPVPPVPYPDPNLPYYRRIPTGAVWLILLGLFFLFGNTGIFHILPGRLFGPFVLIGVGVWVFVRKMTCTGQGLENDGTPQYHWRLACAVRSSFWILLTGVIWLLDVVHILSWAHSWPLYLIAAGVLVLLKRSAYGAFEPVPVYPPTPGAPHPPTAPPVASTAIVPSDQPHVPGNGQEGR
jgi:hypothetical protein